MKCSRRQFVKMLSFGSATSIIAGKLWQRDLMAFCDPLPDQLSATFTVRVSDYPALQQDFGSVRLGINGVNGGDEPFPDGNFWPILINRDDRGNFFVLDCECRHASCVVPVFGDDGQYLIQCPCHGSQYDIDGSLLWGPATAPLHKYPFDFDGIDTLKIKVPCWGFRTQIAPLPHEKTARVRIDFETFPNVTYEAKSRDHLSADWSPATFSNTPDGISDQTNLMGDGNVASIFLDRARTSAFYAVDMILSEV